MKDPRPGLALLGVETYQVVAPNDGYDGTYTPEAVYLHWTASAAGSDVSDHVVAINDYHACINRKGICKLGGWQVKQAHGGSGRTQPIDLARTGGMTVDTLVAWQNNPAGDNTDSMPNRYGLAVAIDNNGVGEPVPSAQWHAFTATAAVLLDCIGRTGPDWLIDHAASTNRKIDLATSPALPPARWYADIATQLAILQGGPPAMADILRRIAIPRTGHGMYGVSRDGGLFTLNEKGRNDAVYYGSLFEPGVRKSDAPVADLELTGDGRGYWITTEDGLVYPFGNAGWLGNFDKLMNP